MSEQNHMTDEQAWEYMANNTALMDENKVTLPNGLTVVNISHKTMRFIHEDKITDVLPCGFAPDAQEELMVTGECDNVYLFGSRFTAPDDAIAVLTIAILTDFLKLNGPTSKRMILGSKMQTKAYPTYVCCPILDGETGYFAINTFWIDYHRCKDVMMAQQAAQHKCNPFFSLN